MNSSPPSWLDTRAAGVLAHLSSLPGEYGIGNLGAAAHRFIDFLSDANVRYWQICPIGPTGFGDSPYQLFSSRAGNPYFIDLGVLQREGLLENDELAPLRALPRERVDYGRLYALFWSIVGRAYDRFADAGVAGVAEYGDFAAFCLRHAGWLRPFAEFMALKTKFGGRPWTEWPEALRRWRPELRSSLDESACRDADRRAFFQYVFFGQWERLRRYAAENRVGIIGDVPIFVALDSADTWQNRAVFRLDPHGQPVAVAGVPPDYFAAQGQLWGNPLYNWDYLAHTGYGWWIDRLRAAFQLYDIIRLDHFRGFDSYWEISAGAPDASRGRWLEGPGLPFFRALRAALPQARIIAEDLGYIGPGVVELRRTCGLPGMKVLQFAYGHDVNNINLPHFYTPDSVVYTGTHDNNTSRGWLESLRADTALRVDEYFQLGGARSAWPIIRSALAAVSRLAIIPVQDIMDLPAEAALNRPGTTEGNWQWRFTDEQLAALAGEETSRLRQWIHLYDRTGDRTISDFSEPLHDRSERAIPARDLEHELRLPRHPVRVGTADGEHERHLSMPGRHRK